MAMRNLADEGCRGSVRNEEYWKGFLAAIEAATEIINKPTEHEAIKTPENAATTRRFEVRHIMVGHCGERLTPDNVDKIAEEILAAIETGACSWAFLQNSSSLPT